MKIEIRNGAEIRVSGYVNAVERDSRILPPEMAGFSFGQHCGASSRFVEKVSAGAFKRALARNPNVRLYYNHEREIGSVSGGQLQRGNYRRGSRFGGKTRRAARLVVRLFGS